ncbi:hypothetical protein EV1_040864 [Malus domestica]
MATTNTTSVSLKLLIDTKGHKVLFAEAIKEVVDFLFTLLTFPVATVIMLLSKNDIVGCLGQLCESVENLSDAYLQPNFDKDALLKPNGTVAGANIFHLLTSSNDCNPKQLYICTGFNRCICDVSGTTCPQCPHGGSGNYRAISTPVTYVDPQARTSTNAATTLSVEGGYVKGVGTHMIMDNLEVNRMSTISSITVLKMFNIKEVGVPEEKMVNLGMVEGLKLLKASLESNTVILSPMCFLSLLALLTACVKMANSESTVSLKLLVDSKRHKVLFAEAGKDFVDFLFTLLSLPVGTVIRLLAKHGMVGSLGKLYESVETLSDTYMQPNLDKDTLLKPKPAIGGTDVLHLLAGDEATRKVYMCRNYHRYVADDSRAICPSCNSAMSTEVPHVAPQVASGSSSGEGGGYVKGLVTYMIMDNLEVKPMSTISGITVLNKFNVKDVGALEEKVVHLGMQEGISLLKASLQSNYVLTSVFLGKKVA